MSVYEDYERTSAVYDTSRRAVGIEFYIGALITHTGKPLHQIRALDVGCGTGNYTHALLSAGVGHVSMYDANAGMLEKARAKCEHYMGEGRCDAKQGVLPALPYETGSLDMVMCNQVIHHLDANGGKFATLRATLHEMVRVLRPGGLILINYCTKEQMQSYWYTNLAPAVANDFKKRLPSIDDFKRFFSAAGAELVCADVPVLDTLISPHVYHRYSDGVDDPIFRNVDSFWTLLSADQLSAVQEEVRRLRESGGLAGRVEEWEAYRRQHGQCTTLLALRSRSRTLPDTGAADLKADGVNGVA